MSQITIKNISTATVVLSVPESSFRRVLPPGRVIPVTQREYDDLMFSPGMNTLVRGHYVKINGVEKDKQVEEVNNVYEQSDIAKMFDELNITAFAKFIPTAAAGEKDTVVKLAVEKGITNSAFTALIQKYCGVDVIKAINTKHLAEE